MIKQHRRAFKVLRLSFDLLLVVLLYYALYLGTLYGRNPLGLVLVHPDYQWRLPLLLALAWAFSFLGTGAYDRTRISPGLLPALGLAGRSVLVMLLAFTLGLFAFKIQFLSRKFIAIYAVGGLGLLSLTKLLELRLLSWLRGLGYNTMSVLFVGDAPALRELSTVFEKHEEWGYRVLGLIAPKRPTGVLNARWLGSLGALERVLRTRIVDEIVVALVGGRKGELDAVLRAAAVTGARVRLLLPEGLRGWSPQIDTMGGLLDTLDLQAARRHPYKLMLKAVLEWLLALAAFVALLPLMAAIALAVWLSMGRPVFFTQKRAGRSGRVFNLYKFRTMVAGARAQQAGLSAHNEMDGPAFKLRRDPRVTALGRLLRRASLDELPQLWNVLRGDMAIVGPRAMAQYEARKVPAWALRRFSVKPGVTCLREVSGRSQLSFEQWMRSDLAYLERWSLGLDARIILQTLPAVLSSRGAY